jgi:TrmH family RNA methyltransferase
MERFRLQARAMEDLPVITSRSNALVQRARRVVSGDEAGFLALEGDRLVDDAITAGSDIEVVMLAADRRERADELAKLGQRVQLVDASIVEQVSSLDKSPGILAIATIPKAADLETSKLDGRTLIVVVAGVADPGNLGALARAAEAFGATTLVALAGGAAPWSTKALRGSMGSLLRLPVAAPMQARACFALLSRRKVRQVCATTRGGIDPQKFDWQGPIALWVTGETGVAPDVGASFESVTIPIAAQVESLNVTVAASIVLFCASRARAGRRG